MSDSLPAVDKPHDFGLIAGAIGPPLTIDSGEITKLDPSTSAQTLTPAQWDRLSGQRDVMIKAMVGVFTDRGDSMDARTGVPSWIEKVALGAFV